MATASKSIAVRLTLEGGQKVKAEMEGVGAAGDEALKRIASSTAPASTGLEALNAVTGELRSGIEGMGGAASPAMRALSGLGVAGSAAAVGLGALAAALTVLYRMAGQSLEVVGKMTDQADQLGLSYERFQQLEYVFAAVGVGADQMTRGLTKFSDAIGPIMAQGEDAPKGVIKAFERLGITIEQIEATGGDVYKVLQLVSDGLAGMGSRAEQTAAMVDLFGIKNAALLPILARGSQALNDQAEAASQAGRILSNELGAKYDETADKSAALDIAIRNQTAAISEDMIPAVVKAKEAHLALLDALKKATDYFPSFDQAVGAAVASLGPLANALFQIVKLMGLVRGQAGVTGSWGPPGTTGSWGDKEQRQQKEPVAPVVPVPRPAPSGQRRGGAADTAARQSAADQKVLDDLARSIQTVANERQRSIDQALSRLSSNATAAQRAEVEKLAGALYDQAEAEKKRAEAHRTAAAELDRNRAAVSRLNEQFQTLDQMRAGQIATIEALARVEDERGQAILGTAEKQRALQAVDAEYYEALQRAQDSAAEAAERRLYESREFSDGLKRGLDDWVSEATDAAALAETAVQSAADGMADAIAEFVMTGKANFADLATAVIAEINRMVVRMLIAMAIQRAIGMAVGSAGGMSGGTGQANTMSGGGSDALVAHTGGVIGVDPLPRRLAPAAAFVDAPRYHSGGMAGEVPAILKRGEGVFTPGQMRAMGAPQPVNITVNNNARATVDVQQTPSGAQIDIADLIDRTAAGLAATPGTRLNRALAR